MELASERLRLRAPGREHVEHYLRWFNNPEICQYIRRVRPLGRIEEEEFIAGIHRREAEILFMIEAREGSRIIGCCGLHQIHSPNRNAEIGIVIGESGYWSRGYGGEAMELLCRYGFEVLNLHRIGLEVYENNPRARRCYERVGFRLEGERREARFWGGRYWSVFVYGLLEREWREARAEAAPASMCQTRS